MKNEIKENLLKLAQKLSINHITNSLADDSDDVVNKVINIEKKDLDVNKRDSRYILIIGAGASKSACKEILTATDAADDIEKSIYEKYGKVAKELIEKEITKLSHVYRLEEQDFETKLFALNKFFPDDIKSKLEQLYNKKYEISLFYEIVGHLLKHRFIDVILNYNFDEILDNVIEEELTNVKYPVIYSDGHCPKDYNTELINEDKAGLMYPLYIKPHGTISHYSTLRFTRESYYDISNEISTLIKNIIDGRGIESNKRKYEINFILVGFSMKSFELNEIIKDSYDEIIRSNSSKNSHEILTNNSRVNTYIFDTNKKDDYLEELKYDKDLFKILSAENETSKIHYFRINENYTLDKYFKEMWGNIQGQFKNHHKPKGIERHLFLSDIFQNDEKLLNGFGNNEKKYFLTRTYAEIVLASLSSDGLLNSTQILSSRIIKYYELYRRKEKRYKLTELIKKIGLKEYKGYVNDTFIVNPQDKEEPEDFMFNKFLKTIKEKVSESNEIYSKLKNNEKVLKGYLKTLKSRNLLRVNYDYNTLFQSKFEYLYPTNIIRTDLDWSYRFSQNMNDKNWDILFAISEEGRFLSSIKNIENFVENKRYAEIILSDKDDGSNKIDLGELPLLSKSPNYLPWWLHNQHLVLFARIDKNDKNSIGNFKLLKGFYYKSRTLQRIVTPLEIDHPFDLRTLFEIFLTYLIRAESYKESDFENVYTPKEFKEIKKKRNQLFKKIIQRMIDNNKD
jgi:hypothetical protein